MIYDTLILLLWQNKPFLYIYLRLFLFFVQSKHPQFRFTIDSILTGNI